MRYWTATRMRCRTALLLRSDLSHDPVLAGPGAAVMVWNASGCPYNEITILLAPFFTRAGLADPLRGYPVASAPAVESHAL
jgi:hypothetical protein